MDCFLISVRGFELEWKSIQETATNSRKSVCSVGVIQAIEGSSVMLLLTWEMNWFVYLFIFFKFLFLDWNLSHGWQKGIEGSCVFFIEDWVLYVFMLFMVPSLPCMNCSWLSWHWDSYGFVYYLCGIGLLLIMQNMDFCN